jgi:hypothetical protein
MADTDTDTNTGGFSLTKRVAGMPTYAWMGVAAAGGVVILLWWRSRGSSQSQSTSGQTMTPVDTGIQGSDLASIISTLQGPSSTSTMPETNDDWERKALQWVSERQTQGVGVTPVVAQVALSDYLNGKPLGEWEQWTINTIITGTNQNGKNFGQGVGPPPNVPTSGGFR